MPIPRLIRHVVPTAALAITLATPAAQAGLLITPQGLFLTEPEIPSFVRDETGQAQFGSPATGFRRFGRSGFFPTPVDPTLPRQGRNAFGGERFYFTPAEKAPATPLYKW
ncbi:MAG: hypothetical protein AAFR17_00280 [Pseudomonadota bacterium]